MPRHAAETAARFPFVGYGQGPGQTHELPFIFGPEDCTALELNQEMAHTENVWSVILVGRTYLSLSMSNERWDEVDIRPTFGCALAAGV